MTRWILVVLIGAIAGCASSAPPSPLVSAPPPPAPPRPSALLLEKADRLAAQGQYGGALDAYGEILTKYGDTDEAGRARGGRDTVAHLLAARAQVTRLTAEMKAQEAELTRAREQVAARDGELSRARQEIGRLTAEVDRLRADLETLKKIDIDLERRRK